MKPGPSPEVSREEIIRAINDARPPALGTSDVADRIGISRQATDKHLWRMQDDGLVHTDNLGQTRIWWVSTDGRDFLNQ